MVQFSMTDMHQVSSQPGWRFGIPTLLSSRVKISKVGAGSQTPSAENTRFNNRAKAEARELQGLRMELLNLLDDHVFMLHSMRYLQFKLARDQSGFVADISLPPHYHERIDAVDFEEEQRMILRRRKDAEIIHPTIQGLFKSMTADILRFPAPPNQAPELDEWKFMLRAVLPHSASRFDADLGFRCGNFHEAAPDFHSEALELSPRLSATKLLRRMRVLFECTTTLAENLGIPRPEYATENFWIAYRWIPAECIECFLTLKGFHEICEKSEYKILTAEDLISAPGLCHKSPPPKSMR
ncbi:hypothetical protein ED733_000273 [Metarhizium rileyi]|uniref:Uncharacterized protein n=1 Tax=Metarhizium rileyi (strain RCEF 4871) TaxID=1649241 RepID=A0A5C6G352_METRR|nr:hypothetical protein ED733_000273 [Metarhizium rileyi]